MLHRYPVGHGLTSGARFSPDEKSIVVACGDSSIAVIDAASGAEKEVIRDFPAPYTDVEISHDGKQILGLTSYAVVDYDSIRVELAGVTPGINHSEFSLKVFPNPWQGSASAVLTAPHPTTATLLICDQLGREVASVWTGPIQTEETVRLELSKLRLSAGAYSLVARTSSGTVRTGLMLLP